MQPCPDRVACCLYELVGNLALEKSLVVITIRLLSNIIHGLQQVLPDVLPGGLE